MQNGFPIELLRPYWLPNINMVKVANRGDFKSWLRDLNYTFYQQPNKNGFELYIKDEQSLAKAISFDINKFSTASFESVHSITKTTNLPKANAWQLIKLYYSAFFATHAILRIFGRPAAFLSPDELKQLSIFSGLMNYQWELPLANTFFTSEYDHNRKVLTFKKRSDTHSDTWNAFYLLIRDIANKTLSGNGLQEEINRVVIVFQNIIDSITDYGKLPRGHWLSMFRNDINYKQEYGVWFPYKNCEICYNDIGERLKFGKKETYNITIYKSTSNSLRFVQTCILINCFCNTLLDDIKYASIYKRSFVDYGKISFLNISKMKI